MPRHPLRLAIAVGLAGAALALAGCSAGGGSGPTPTPTVSTTHKAALDIHVGDCLDDADVGTTASSAPTVDCSQPHDSEAFAEFTVPDGAFPGDDALKAQASTDCKGTAFAEFIGIASADSTLQVSYYFPTEDSWAGGDRAITCTVYQVGDDGKPAKTTGTLKNSAE
jgi:hypothetical protein